MHEKKYIPSKSYVQPDLCLKTLTIPKVYKNNNENALDYTAWKNI